MYLFRPFHNADPPRIAHLWASQPPQRGLAQPLNVGILDQYLFAKHYFDPEGLIVATEEDQLAGFVHAGFGPGDDFHNISTQIGAIYMLMVRPELWNSSLPQELLAKGEAYLKRRGAHVWYGGGIQPLNGFYLGLYGGSELPGVLLSDTPFHQVLAQNNYVEAGRVHVLHRDLVRFRAPVSRDQRRIRREVTLETIYSPPTQNWWETSVYANLERIDFRLLARRGGEVLASSSYWDIEPLATSWGIRAAGLYDLQVSEKLRRQGYATYLLGESFKELYKRGVTLVEAQTMQTNEPAIELYKKLGFAPVDHGLIMRRENTD